MPRLRPLRQLVGTSQTQIRRYFSPEHPLGLLRQIQALSIGSDTLMTVALAGSLFFSISPDEARTKVTLYLLFTMVPFALMAPLIAPLIDRGARYRRRVVLGSALTRVVGVALMIFEIHSILLFPLALLNLVASKAYLVAKSSLVPELIAHDATGKKLVAANSNLTLLAAAAGVLAAIVGAAILKTPFLGARYDLVVELIPLAYLIVSAQRLLRQLPIRGSMAQKASAKNPLDDEIPPVATREPRTTDYSEVLLLSLIIAVLRGQVGFFAFLVAFAFKYDHSPTWVYGAALVASAIGAALATQITPRLRRKIPESAIVVIAVCIVGISSLALATGTSHPGAIALAALLGVASGGSKIAFDATVQQRLARHRHGRAFARYESSFQLAWVIGAFIPTLARLQLSAGEIVLGVTAVLALVSYLIGAAALRHSGDLPEDGPDWYAS
ncbi:MAG: MFS transporter [Ferrimicrobium sp.]